ncbi:MAG: 50S ribosomal protein L11 methyltransferase [Thermodesulforhabdaceae bacterium]
MAEETIITVYECRWNDREVFPPEPSHPAYKGMYREGKWCYFFFSETADEYFNLWLKTQARQSIENCQRLSFPLSSWQEFSSTLRVGSFLIVSSSSAEVETTGNTIKLLPSISFGSGTHPSTKACLMAMEKVFSESKPDVVMDLGTGSGILAFGALLLGANKVIASDISHLAIKEARKNSFINNLHEKLQFIVSDGLSAVDTTKISLVVMNLEWPSLETVFRNSSWWSCDRIVVCGFPSFCWQHLLRRLELSLFFVEDLSWVEEWGAAIISQHLPPYSSPQAQS